MLQSEQLEDLRLVKNKVYVTIICHDLRKSFFFKNIQCWGVFILWFKPKKRFIKITPYIDLPKDVNLFL